MSGRLLLAALTAALLAAAPQQALGKKKVLPVIDHRNLSANNQILGIVAQQQRDIQTLLAHMHALRLGHGDQGSLSGMIHSVMRLIDGSQRLGGAARDLRGAGPPDYRKILPAVNTETLGLPILPADGADFATIAGARDFIRVALEPAARDSAAAAAIKSRRAGVYDEAITMALALAMHNRSTATQVPGHLEKLAEQAARASTVRDQQAASAAITLAVVEELAAIRGLLAAYVNMVAARELRDRGVEYGPATNAASPPGLLSPEKP